MYDGYGDGWQSTGIEVCVDENCQTITVPSGNYNDATISVPAGTGTLTWNWGGDSWTNEVFVVVYAPDGSLLFFGTGEDYADMALYTNGDYPADVWANTQDPAHPDYGIHTTMATGLQPITLCAQ